MIRVILAEDLERGPESLLPYLAATDEVEVVGSTRDGAEALALSRALRADVLLLDLAASPLAFAALARQATADGIKATLILTSAADEAQVRDALGAGPGTVLRRALPPTVVLQAIHTAAEAPPLRRPTTPMVPPDPFRDLTDREREVLTLVADGFSNKEIGVRLGLTVGTVKGYVSTILTKLSVADRTQAAVYALRHGLVHPEDSTPT